MIVRMQRVTRLALSASLLFVSLNGCAGSQSTSAVPVTNHAFGGQKIAYRPMIVSGGARSVLPDGFKPNAFRPGWMKSPPVRPDVTGRPHIAVAQFGSTSVLWFRLNDKNNKAPKTCQPASSTNGIAIDRSGNLWVPDGRANTTTEYAPNCGSAILTIPEPTGEPADVGFDGKNHVYILNLNDVSGPPTVEYYNSTNGAHLGTLSDPSFNILFGIATDQLGNVFVSNLTTNNVGIVIEFPNGKMPGTQLSGISLGLPGAPAFDSANNMIIADWLRNTIDVFTPPYTGSPTTAPLMGISIWCKLNHAQSHLYCGDAGNGAIDVYAYPGDAYLYSYTSGLSANNLVTGVAPAPAAAYGR